MDQITEQGRAAIKQIADRNQVSEAAAMDLLHALQRGHGTAAQFDIRELGGMGQWSSGGMTQVGDMFNDGLKQKVRGLCDALAGLLHDHSLFDEENATRNYNPDGTAGGNASGGWWPQDLGRPSSTGGQNDMEYALFPHKQMLAVRQNGSVTLYDSGDHRIGGFAQAQGGGGQTLNFTSQHGTISTKDLKRID